MFCYKEILLSLGRHTFYIKSFYLMGKALPGELSCSWTGLVENSVCHVSCLDTVGHLGNTITFILIVIYAKKEESLISILIIQCNLSTTATHGIA